METGTQECKLHYCTLASVLPVGIFHTDVVGHYLSVNECWCEIAGITAAEAEGNGWVQLLYPDDKERVFAQWYRAVRDNLPFRAEYRFQRPDGKITWVLGQAVAEKDKTGAVIGYIGTITDITEHKRTEEELSKYRHHLEELVQERTAELLHANERFKLAAAAVNCLIYDWGVKKNQVQRTQGLVNLLGYRPEEAEPTADWWRDRIHPDDWQRLQPLMSAALANENVYAFEYRVRNKDNQYLHVWDHGLIIRDADGRAVRVVGSTMDITKRKQTEEALRETNEILQALVQSAPLSIIILAPDGRVKLWNRAAEKMFGWSEQEVLFKPLPTVPQDQQQDFYTVLNKQFSGKKFSAIETKRQHKDGTLIDVSICVAQLRDAKGNIVGSLGIIADITERKRVQQALQESYNLLRAVIESTPDYVFAKDLEGRLMMLNSPVAQVLGKPPEELIGKSDAELWPPETARQIREKDLEIMTTGVAETVEEVVVLKEGLLQTTLTTKSPWRDRQGKIIGLIGIARDISNRKRMEEELRESQERLRLFIHHAPAAVAMFDCQMRYIAVSRRWLTDYNVDEQNIIGKCHYDVFPDFPERWKEVHQRCLKGAVERCESDRFNRANGAQTWVRWEVRPWHDRKGEIGGIVIFNENITERKQAEVAIKQHKELLQTIFDHIPVMVAFFDATDQLQMVNREWERILGWSLEQMQSRNIFAEFYPDPEYRQAIFDYILTADGKWGDFKTKIRDGRILDTSWANVRLSDGSSIGIGQDITDRKQMEEALRQQFLRERLLAATLGRIHQSLNLEEILNTTAAEVRQFLVCDRVIIYRLQSDGSGVVVVESVGSEWRPISGTIIQDCYFCEKYFQLYQQGRIQAVEDIYTAGLTPCHVDLLAQFQVRANLVVPIVQEEQLWGLLVAQQCSGTRQWQSVEINLLKSLATQSAIAIQKSELYQQAQAEIAQRQQAEAVLRQQFLKERLMMVTLGRIRQSLNLEEILNTTVAEVRQFLQTDRVLIYRLWPNGTGSAVTEAVVPGQPAVLGRTFPEEVFPQESHELYRQGRILAISDIEQAGISPCLAEFVKQFGVKAKLVVPILQEEALWGLLLAHHCSGPRQWQPLEIDFLKSLSTQVAIALQQSQLYKHTQYQVHREQALNRVIQTIRNSLDLTTIFSTAVSEIAQLLETDRADIMQYLPEHKLWRLVAEYPQTPDSSNTLSVEVPDDGHEIAARLKRLEIVRIDDTSTGVDDPINRGIAQTFPRAWLLVPLNFSDFVWGSLSLVRNTGPSTWQDSEVELACAVANQLAIALQQAELYQQSRAATAKALTQAQQLEQALSELQTTQTQLVQSEKMSSLGQLVAGVAHEINNPVTFIYANLAHAEEYSQDILGLLQLYQQQYPNPTPEISSEIEAIELDFLIEDLPKLLSSMKVGAERICEIVVALRNFSRLAEAEMKAVDIHEGLDSTLTILQNRLKAQGKHREIQVIKEYGNLPKVECYAGQLNQVFMNLLSNAIEALEELYVDQLLAHPQSSYQDIAQEVESDAPSVAPAALLADNLHPSNRACSAAPAPQYDLCSAVQPSNLQPATPCIRIRTEVINNQLVAIRIADNGSGMTEQVKARLFDPFFTTKPVGAGTGLGLSISYEIVVKKHGGQLRCFSELGQGTEFVIQIPISPRTLGVPE